MHQGGSDEAVEGDQEGKSVSCQTLPAEVHPKKSSGKQAIGGRRRGGVFDPLQFRRGEI